MVGNGFVLIVFGLLVQLLEGKSAKHASTASINGNISSILAPRVAMYMPQYTTGYQANPNGILTYKGPGAYTQPKETPLYYPSASSHYEHEQPEPYHPPSYGGGHGHGYSPPPPHPPPPAAPSYSSYHPQPYHSSASMSALSLIAFLFLLNLMQPANDMFDRLTHSSATKKRGLQRRALPDPHLLIPLLTQKPLTKLGQLNTKQWPMIPSHNNSNLRLMNTSEALDMMRNATDVVYTMLKAYGEAVRNRQEPSCVLRIMCEVNKNARQKYRFVGRYLAQVSSVATSFALSQGQPKVRANIMRAAQLGRSNHDCQSLFPSCGTNLDGSYTELDFKTKLKTERQRRKQLKRNNNPNLRKRQQEVMVTVVPATVTRRLDFQQTIPTTTLPSIPVYTQPLKIKMAAPIGNHYMYKPHYSNANTNQIYKFKPPVDYNFHKNKFKYMY